MLPRACLRFGSESCRHVVVIDDGVVFDLVWRQSDAGVVFGSGRSRAGVRSPRVEGLTGQRDHRVEEDQKIDAAPSADDRRDETTHRRRDEDDVGAATGRVDDSIRVAGKLFEDVVQAMHAL
jgi:hypothetical protein